MTSLLFRSNSDAGELEYLVYGSASIPVKKEIAARYMN